MLVISVVCLVRRHCLDLKDLNPFDWLMILGSGLFAGVVLYFLLGIYVAIAGFVSGLAGGIITVMQIRRVS